MILLKEDKQGSSNKHKSWGGCEKGLALGRLLGEMLKEEVGFQLQQTKV